MRSKSEDDILDALELQVKIKYRIDTSYNQEEKSARKESTPTIAGHVMVSSLTSAV